ncbi:MAG: hypothetical protein MJE63_22630 [Proteobacteria bacterium]|nr:hypothetical protein [Pseudomonadota bacterium]
MIVILVAVLLTPVAMARPNHPAAIDGVLDLRDWDFERQGLVELKGEWDF